MSHEPKLTSGKGSMEKRIADRQKTSNDHSTADVHYTTGTGERRTSTTIHSTGNVKAHHGSMPKGEGK